MPPRKALRGLAVAAFWLAVWQALALLVHNPVLLVGPGETLRALFAMLPTAAFWRAVLGSVGRIAAGFLAGAVCGAALAFPAWRFRLFREVFSPLAAVLKAIPVVSFVILLLIWAGSKLVSLFVTFIVVFPLLYISTLEGLLATDRKLLELARVYRMGPAALLRGILFPQLRPHLRGAVSLAVGMAWRAGVAAEVIGQPAGSLGNELYRAKIYLETDRVLAVTAVTVLLSWALGRLALLLFPEEP